MREHGDSLGKDQFQINELPMEDQYKLLGMYNRNGIDIGNLHSESMYAWERGEDMGSGNAVKPND